MHIFKRRPERHISPVMRMPAVFFTAVSTAATPFPTTPTDSAAATPLPPASPTATVQSTDAAHRAGYRLRADHAQRGDGVSRAPRIPHSIDMHSAAGFERGVHSGLRALHLQRHHAHARRLWPVRDGRTSAVQLQLIHDPAVARQRLAFARRERLVCVSDRLDFQLMPLTATSVAAYCSSAAAATGVVFVAAVGSSCTRAVAGKLHLYRSWVKFIYNTRVWSIQHHRSRRVRGKRYRRQHHADNKYASTCFTRWFRRRHRSTCLS